MNSDKILDNYRRLNETDWIQKDEPDLYSNCCGAWASDYYVTRGICPKCKENCDFEEIDEVNNNNTQPLKLK